VKYPGGPAESYFRFAISSEHSREQLDAVIEAVGPGPRRGASDEGPGARGE